MDEATNELAFIATGIYGKPLPNQNGAPIRLVTPWKYGFKGIKSIVTDRIHRRRSPTTPGSRSRRSEYGFYANVNPTRGSPALVAGERARHRRRHLRRARNRR